MEGRGREELEKGDERDGRGGMGADEKEGWVGEGTVGEGTGRELIRRMRGSWNRKREGSGVGWGLGEEGAGGRKREWRRRREGTVGEETRHKWRVWEGRVRERGMGLEGAGWVLTIKREGKEKVHVGREKEGIRKRGRNERDGTGRDKKKWGSGGRENRRDVGGKEDMERNRVGNGTGGEGKGVDGNGTNGEGNWRGRKGRG